MNLYIALPAYNEEESLPNLLRRFNDLPTELRARMKIVVVNDGSSDETTRVASEDYGDIPVQVVEHEVNRGLGQAVQTGIRTVVAQASPDDVLILMDADDTHDPALIEKMSAEIASGADIVIASRFVPGGDDTTAPPFRRLLSRGAAHVFRAALPVDKSIGDFTSGYRAYRISLLRRAIDHFGERLVEEQGFACMVELLLKLRFCKPKITEVAMYLEYDRKQGASKIRIVRTIIQYLRLAIRDRVSPPPYRNL